MKHCQTIRSLHISKQINSNWKFTSLFLLPDIVNSTCCILVRALVQLPYRVTWERVHGCCSDQNVQTRFLRSDCSDQTIPTRLFRPNYSDHLPPPHTISKYNTETVILTIICVLEYYSSHLIAMYTLFLNHVNILRKVHFMSILPTKTCLLSANTSFW